MVIWKILDLYSLILNRAGGQGLAALHQDIQFVIELTKYSSGRAWLPLPVLRGKKTAGSNQDGDWILGKALNNCAILPVTDLSLMSLAALGLSFVNFGQFLFLFMIAVM